MSGSNIGKFGFAKLGTDNYATWSTRMQALLWSKELGEALEDAAHAGSTKAKGLLIMCVRRDVKHVVGGTEANLRTQVQILSLSKPGNKLPGTPSCPHP